MPQHDANEKFGSFCSIGESKKTKHWKGKKRFIFFFIRKRLNLDCVLKDLIPSLSEQ